ncbi:uncharacterized protein LOC110457140 [Mizuhopecten yessoensis]|uniref:uncharacterized protein LOC110457140 n=1 Tax=Mizuhopecten yessoensis TaxID=6573 RepID=UPI000B45A441|nr:uncharacterized protein LOC110457140 [Mizuhopecten yessoensis]
MATSLYKFKGQIPFRTKGQTTCLHHKGGQLDLYCKKCQELACIKCLSTVHNSHPLCGLSEIASEKKRDIHNFVDKTEKVDLVQIDQYITATDKQLKDKSSNFEKNSHQLKTQTNKLKEDLDLLTAQTLSFYQQMEAENTKLLETYKQDLEMYSTQLKQQVQECKMALQRGSDIQIYDTGCEIQSSFTLPVKPSLSTASFTPNLNPQSHLDQAFGEVNTSCEGQGQASRGHDRSIGSSAGQGQSPFEQWSEPKGRTPYIIGVRRSLPRTSAGPSPSQQWSERKERTSSTQQRSKGRKEVSSPVYTLLSQTKVLGEWESPCLLYSVCPTTNGQVWTSYHNSDTLTLLDRKCNVTQEVKHNNRITDISLSPTTNTLWVCDEKNKITELVSGRLVHRFSTREEPRCICITASNHVIVGMMNNISKFSTKGKSVHNTSVGGPHRISECPFTQNVAVAAWYSEGDAKGKPHVVVMDTDFKELFVYDGEVPHTYQSTSQSGCAPFKPQGVLYDSVGNLVIADRNNNRILLISGRGEFLRIIHTDDYCTEAVGVDREDVLWAVFGGYVIKLLRYSSV